MSAKPCGVFYMRPAIDCGPAHPRAEKLSVWTALPSRLVGSVGGGVSVLPASVARPATRRGDPSAGASLKDGYALGKIPTKNFEANEAFFQIVLLAYNLLNWFKRL